jgi:tRNA threonylcarbamoyladenosine biosynthesis protein TsaE
LVGDLASGKTTLVKGIALGLGVKSAREVKSPTFVIFHIYPGRRKFSNGVYKGCVPLYHFDLYRLDSKSDLEGIGLDEYLFARDAVSVIEWAERIPEVLKRSDVKIELKSTGETKRTITLR